MVSLGNVILALTITTPEEPIKNLLVVLGVVAYGIFAGFLNGFFTATLGLQPMITTFATSFVYSGLALLLMPNPAGAIPRDYTGFYRNTSFLGIPLALYIIGLVLLLWRIVKNRQFGRYLFAAGGDPQAAYTTGIRVTRIRISTYMISGFFAALAAISYSLLTGSGSAISGNDMTLTSITAAILGGTALSGGAGSLFGTVLGAIILGTFKNIISGARVDSWYQVLINALFIILALAGPGLINLIRGRYQNE
jgi:ribose transport system permease protein